MEIIHSIFFGIVNFIISGRAKAICVALLGLGISCLLFQEASVFLNTFMSLSPKFNEYVFHHRVWFMGGLFFLYIIPASIGCYVCYNKLNYINNKTFV